MLAKFVVIALAFGVAYACQCPSDQTFHDKQVTVQIPRQSRANDIRPALRQIFAQKYLARADPQNPSVVPGDTALLQEYQIGYDDAMETRITPGNPRQVCFRAQYRGAHFDVQGQRYTADIDMIGTTTADSLTNTVCSCVDAEGSQGFCDSVFRRAVDGRLDGIKAQIESGRIPLGPGGPVRRPTF